MKKSASELVVEYIQEKMASGVWEQGMKIATEDQLKEAVGVSKASVRAAVEKLVAMGVLVKRQGDGTYVSHYDVGTAFEQLAPGFMLNAYDPITVLEFREVIEPACTSLFIQHFQEERFAQLQSYLRCMEENEQGDGEAFYQADRDFHLTIALGTENSILIKIMEILHGTFTNYHQVANRTIGAKTGAKEHAAILDAIRMKDEELAALLMKRHIQRSKADILSYQAAAGGDEN